MELLTEPKNLIQLLSDPSPLILKTSVESSGDQDDQGCYDKVSLTLNIIQKDRQNSIQIIIMIVML